MWRWAVRVLAWSAGLIALTVVILTVQGHGLATRNVGGEFQPLRVAPSPALIERGRHLSEIRCAGCHAGDPARPDVLSGGRDNLLVLPGVPALGMLVGPNLTPAGALGRASDLEIARAIREGISVHGGPLLFMPSGTFRLISDRDLAALIAFLRAQPPVSSATPPRRLTWLADFTLGLHRIEDSVVPPVIVPVADIPPDSVARYGRYLADYLGCRKCHGASLRGGVRGQLGPRGSDLVAFAAHHDLSQFERAVRHGADSAGRSIDPGRMPWRDYSRLTDAEVAALYQLLGSPLAESAAW